MKFSIQAAVIFIVALLFVASLISVYFAAKDEQTLPLVLVAGANIVAVTLLTFVITRGILRPLKIIRGVVSRIGKGDISLRMKKTGVREIGELQDAFNSMITRVERAQKMKTEFVSLAAHQLRTPLTAIKWSTTMAMEGDAGPVSKEQKELLQKAAESTDRMLRLVNDLLNVAKIEEGRYLKKLTLSRIDDIVKGMVQSYQDLAKRKRVTLLLKDVKGVIPEVVMDEEKMRLVVQNLLENALHYTRKEGKVMVRIEQNAKEIQVSIEDTGIGIPKEQEGRIFEKFFRAANAQKEEVDGSGLGLYLARNIVEAHGGKIWFKSKEGKGTTFVFSLPLTRGVEEFLNKR
ncbi:MAG: HAMP domain-containing sensor histidine kinase [bacterium]|nr:HAMP domain-containing sensor histidine kinase [bacterium]